MWRGSKIDATVLSARYIAAAAWLVCALAAGVAPADRIVLRSNLKIINTPKVEALDEDGVRLAGSNLIGWDEIESISVGPDRQELADRLLSELGMHLYRIRKRLQVGDYEGLLPHAEAVYPRYVDRTSNTAYMVKQALMWGLLAAGRREEAAAPYLGCYDYARIMKGRPIDLPGERRLKYDARTGMTPELRPVWFDAEAAQKVLPAVVKAAGAMRKPMPAAARVYYASLGLTAGDRGTALRVLAGIDNADIATAQLVALVKAQDEVLRGEPGPALSGIETSLESLTAENKPVALYWLGTAKVASPDEATQREGILQLLHLPALYGTAAPELAGAALQQAMDALAKLGNAKGSIAVRKELLQRFGHTYHARQVVQELSPRKDD